MTASDGSAPPPPPQPPEGTHDERRRNRLPWYLGIGAAVVAVVVVVAFVLVRGSGTSSAGEVLLEPAASTGPYPWTGSVSPSGAPTAVPLPSASAPAAPAGGQAALTVVRGDRVGIYGGSTDQAVCDKTKLVDFLERNPGQAAAFAGVLGISPSSIRPYVATLTPVLLGADTRVTNHGYQDGRATPRQSVLQAGTAVLIDPYGVPRVKCGCGNPLLPPRPTTTAPRYTGPRWPGFSPQTVVVVQPAPAPMKQVTVVDVKNGNTITINTGTGTTAGPAPGPSGTTQAAPPAPLPTYVPQQPAQEPQPQQTYVVPPQAPQAPAAVSYRLATISVNREYSGSICSEASSNCVAPGSSQEGPGQRAFAVGWAFLWPAETRVNHNYMRSEVTLTTVPTTLRPGGVGTFAATMSGLWDTTGYGVDRDHTLEMVGGAGSAKEVFPGAPSSTVRGTIRSSGTYTAPANESSFAVPITAVMRFGGDHSMVLGLRLNYIRTS